MGKCAVVLMNLGGPDKQESVQPFLFNLFNDPAIISVPRPLRWFLAQVISRKRAPVARLIYEKLGGGSPLLQETEAQARALERSLGADYRVFLSMRDWHPRSHEAVNAVLSYDPERIVLVPLYPQYSTTTTGSSVGDWNKAAAELGLQKPTAVVGCYATNPLFISAHVKLIKRFLEPSKPNRSQKVLFSAHGLPEKIIAKGDPYQSQVESTAKAIVQELACPHLEWEVCYQSRVGPLRWIGPSTEELITEAGALGKSLVVVPIAFVSEHSETLVELDIEYADLARRAGVHSYQRVPTLGISDDFMLALGNMAKSASCDSYEHPVQEANWCPPQLQLCCKSLGGKHGAHPTVWSGNKP